MANGMLFFQREHGQRMDQYQHDQSQRQRDESEHNALVSDLGAHAQVGVNLTNKTMSLFMSSQHLEEDINETALETEPSSNKRDGLQLLEPDSSQETAGEDHDTNDGKMTAEELAEYCDETWLSGHDSRSSSPSLDTIIAYQLTWELKR